MRAPRRQGSAGSGPGPGAREQGGVAVGGKAPALTVPWLKGGLKRVSFPLELSIMRE